MNDLVVSGSARGAGVGRALLARAEELARKRGCFRMALVTAAWREDAIGFYAGQGWENYGEWFVKPLADGVGPGGGRRSRRQLARRRSCAPGFTGLILHTSFTATGLASLSSGHPDRIGSPGREGRVETRARSERCDDPMQHQLIGREPMTKSRLGRSSEGETKSRLLAGLAAIALFAVVVAVPALAVHDDGIFQLDRNAVTSDAGDPATEGEDWDLVCRTTTPMERPSVSVEPPRTRVG